MTIRPDQLMTWTPEEVAIRSAAKTRYFARAVYQLAMMSGTKSLAYGNVAACYHDGACYVWCRENGLNLAVIQPSADWLAPA